MQITTTQPLTLADTSFQQAYVDEALKMTMMRLGKIMAPRIMKLFMLGVKRIEVAPGVYMEPLNVNWVDREKKVHKLFAYCIGNAPFAILGDSFFDGARTVRSEIDESAQVLAELMKDPIKFVKDLDEKLSGLLGKLVHSAAMLDEVLEPDVATASTTTEFNTIGAPFTYGDLQAWLNVNLTPQLAKTPVGSVDMNSDAAFAVTPMRSIVVTADSVILSPGSKYS